MTKSEIFKAAHTEARKIKAASYSRAFSIGLRRIYNQIEKDAWMAKPVVKTPKFLWLRGM